MGLGNVRVEADEALCPPITTVTSAFDIPSHSPTPHPCLNVLQVVGTAHKARDVASETYCIVKRSRTLREFVREGPRVRYERGREVGIETQMGPVARVRRSSRSRKGEFERAPSGFSRAHRGVRGEQGLRKSTFPEPELKLKYKPRDKGPS